MSGRRSQVELCLGCDNHSSQQSILSVSLGNQPCRNERKADTSVELYREVRSMSNEFTVSVESGIKWVARSAVILGVIILGLSVLYLFRNQQLTIAKEVFEDVVIKTLLPIFNTLIVAFLGWLFGKPVVNSLAELIRNLGNT
jgi:hypothetical protein